MAMRPPIMQWDLFRFRDSAEDKARSEKSMLHLLEAMVAHDLLLLREYAGFPALYEAGIIYQPEAGGDGSNRWQDIISLLNTGWGDCKSFTALRVAELQNQGIKAAPYASWRRGDDGVYRYHALVLRSSPGIDHYDRKQNRNRWFEDPSRRLGMGTAAGSTPREPDYIRPLTPETAPGQPGHRKKGGHLATKAEQEVSDADMAAWVAGIAGEVVIVQPRDEDEDDYGVAAPLWFGRRGGGRRRFGGRPRLRFARGGGRHR